MMGFIEYLIIQFWPYLALAGVLLSAAILMEWSDRKREIK